MDPPSDSESTSLMSGSMQREKQQPDWSRFGLSDEQQKASVKEPYADYEEHEHGYHGNSPTNKNELFHEEQNLSDRPWWKSNFFIREPVLFGTWDGVFTSCMINIFGVVIFLRTGWMVGNAGIGYSILIILLTISVALIAALSAIGVCERCKMESGGVYFLLSHILGARLGASIGVVYCFGQAVACSLYVMGFGESISALMHQDNEWIARGIAVGVVLLLLGINVAGVKWVIRLQLVLLMVLFVAVMDFLVGSFVHTDPEHGVIGYNGDLLANNTGPAYTDGHTFFSIFGVFFPTATGIFAGINMSGDLYNPKQNIPVGTLSAVSVSTFLYLAFVLVLGATCMRDVLQNDYMIAEKVSVVGVLWLAGLYISSISSCMGGLYGSPRILQSIANENVMPIFKFLGQGRGPNKVPVFALIVITMISIIFIFIGNVNTLGPIVTMPFMLTYSAVDYCYFALAMSFDKQKTRNKKFADAKKLLNGTRKAEEQSAQNGTAGYGATDAHDTSKKGDTLEKLNSDLDKLFPERVPHDQRHLHKPISPTTPPAARKTVDFEKGLTRSGSGVSEGDTKSEDDTTQLLDENKKAKPAKPPNTEIIKQPRSCYSIFCNRWLSLFGSVACIIIMFGIQWGYALAVILIASVVYVYIGQANPGVFPGIAEFSMYEWIRDGVKNCCRRGPPPPEQIVVTPNTPAMSTMAAQLTEDNEDFSERGRYHQSEVVKGENFDDYED